MVALLQFGLETEKSQDGLKELKQDQESSNQIKQNSGSS